MKKSRLFHGIIVLLLSCPTVSLADIFFHANGANACDQLAGDWEGRGQASHWAVGTCYYHGSARLAMTDGAGHFSLALNIDKDSGSLLCPAHLAPNLSGYCHDGHITLMTSNGQLTGTVSDGVGQARGSLTVSPGIDAKVSIQLQKVR